MYETFNIIPDKICNGITFNGNKCNKKCDRYSYKGTVEPPSLRAIF